MMKTDNNKIFFAEPSTISPQAIAMPSIPSPQYLASLLLP